MLIFHPRQIVLWTALALLHTHALAQADALDVVSPHAVVPAAHYRSVLPAMANKGEPTPASWQRANTNVGQFPRGHMDIVQWEAAHPEPLQDATKNIVPSAQATGATP